MKAVKSDRLKDIIATPENREKFRHFIATRSATSGQFVTTKGRTNVTFVVEKPAEEKKK